jgi:hypothetical protein
VYRDAAGVQWFNGIPLTVLRPSIEVVAAAVRALVVVILVE